MANAEGETGMKTRMKPKARPHTDCLRVGHPSVPDLREALSRMHEAKDLLKKHGLSCHPLEMAIDKIRHRLECCERKVLLRVRGKLNWIDSE